MSERYCASYLPPYDQRHRRRGHLKTYMQRWLQLLAFLGMIAALNGCGETVNTSEENKIAKPIIEAQIGDTWNEVIQRSTLKLEALPKSGGVVIDRPHTFIYRDPRHRMQLDDVRYVNVFIGYEKTTIRSFGIGPYRESEGVEETWRRLQDIIHKMEQAGWIPDDDTNIRNPSAKSAKQLLSQYRELPGGARGGERFWYDEYGNEAWVELVKTITGQAPGEEPRFNVVLQIQTAMYPKKPRDQK